MLDILNILVAGVQLLSNIALTMDADYQIPVDLDKIVQVSAHREWWREDGNGKCQYQGVMVPYARDWEEVKKNAESDDEVIAAEPGKIAGQAILITSKVCKGKEPEQILRAATYFRKSGTLREGIIIHADDLTEAAKPEQLPKWLPQVISRIEHVATSDEPTRIFMAQTAPLLSKVTALYSNGASTASIQPKQE